MRNGNAIVVTAGGITEKNRDERLLKGKKQLISVENPI